MATASNFLTFLYEYVIGGLYQFFVNFGVVMMTPLSDLNNAYLGTFFNPFQGVEFVVKNPLSGVTWLMHNFVDVIVNTVDTFIPQIASMPLLVALLFLAFATMAFVIILKTILR